MSKKQFQGNLTVEEVILLISKRCCLICQKNLDQELKRNWHIPLCKEHRLEYMEMQK